MRKRFFVGLLVLLLASGGAFAEGPANTITLDIGPTIIGVGGGALLKDALTQTSEGSADTSGGGFGFGLQYERQIIDKFAVGAKFSYLGFSLGMGTTETDDYGNSASASASVTLAAWAIEAHARFYPGNTFFLDGMLGFASMSLGFKGEVAGKDSSGHVEKVTASDSVSRGYFKPGIKIGWRIDFGDPGGFIFEPSFGYYASIGMGDGIGKQAGDKFGVDMSSMDEAFDLMSNIIFVGGPRLSLAFGWKF